MPSRRRQFKSDRLDSGAPVNLLLGDTPFDWPDYERGDYEEIEEGQEVPRDSYVDAAKESLKEFFSGLPESVFYQRQLEVIFEGKYFHWITVKALVELVQEGFIAQERMPLARPGAEIVLYRLSSYRYWRRDADEIIKLVNRLGTKLHAGSRSARRNAVRCSIANGRVHAKGAKRQEVCG